MVREFDRRSHFIQSRLNEIERFKCPLPKGAFYAFPNIGETEFYSKQLAEHLLKEANVLTLLGSHFGTRGRGLSQTVLYRYLQEFRGSHRQNRERFEKTWIGFHQSCSAHCFNWSNSSGRISLSVGVKASTGLKSA